MFVNFCFVFCYVNITCLYLSVIFFYKYNVFVNFSFVFFLFCILFCKHNVFVKFCFVNICFVNICFVDITCL